MEQLTLRQLKELRPCAPGLRRVIEILPRDYYDEPLKYKELILHPKIPIRDILWLLGKQSQKITAEFAIGCALSCIDQYKKIYDDNRPMKAIRAAQNCLRNPDSTNIKAAKNAASAASAAATIASAAASAASAAYADYTSFAAAAASARAAAAATDSTVYAGYASVSAAFAAAAASFAAHAAHAASTVSKTQCSAQNQKQLIVKLLGLDEDK